MSKDVDAGTVEADVKPQLFAWKRLSDGKIMTPYLAHSKEELFENAGFGAVRVDEPIKGFLAVEVRQAGTRLIEVKKVA